MTDIVRRKKKLLYLGAFGKSLRCCCECCIYEGDCIKRRYIPNGDCENPYEVDRFRGTITVEWCGISYTFSPDDRPAQYNFAIGPAPISTGNETACGTIFFTGQTRPVLYKDEQAFLYILGGPASPPDDASADCLRIFVPIATRLQGALHVVYEDGSTFGYDLAQSDQEFFVFTQDQCRRNKLVRVGASGNSCTGSGEHLFCRVNPVVTVNEPE